MLVYRGTKAECIRKMLELEAVYGRNFWVVSMDDAAGTYALEASEEIAGKLTAC